MTPLKRIKNLVVVFLVFLGIGGCGFLAVDSVKGKANWIVRDTLPGLSYGGEFAVTLSEGFTSVSLLLGSDGTAEVAKYQSQIDKLSKKNWDFLTQYETSIFAREDQRNFDELMRVRKRYLEIQYRVLTLVRSGKRAESLEVFKADLVPAYTVYARASQVLFEYNVRMAQSRGPEILRSCAFTQIAVGIIGLVLFFAGYWMAMLSPTEQELRLMTSHN